MKTGYTSTNMDIAYILLKIVRLCISSWRWLPGGYSLYLS